jgi:2',3'-cyclic-nucleotide 2'-phosphodiesterase/3'-nucleotidase
MKKSLRFLMTLLLLVSILFMVTAQPIVEQTPVLVSLDIYSTNALHGRVESGDGAGIALLGSYIHHFRENNPDMIMLDAGNALQGTAVSTFFDGKPVIEFFNMAGYDALNCGNHELDWKPSDLKKIMKDADFPLLGANIVTRDAKPADFTTPYVILNRGGVSVGIIGLIDPSHFNSIASSSLEGLAFMDAALTANHLIPMLKSQGVEVIVLLAMVPGWTDENGKAEGNLIDLAYAVPEADAIVGSLHNEVVATIEGTPVVLAWRYGEKLGHIKLQYDKANRKVVSSEVELITVKGDPLHLGEDNEIAAMLRNYTEALKESNTKQIGVADKALVRGPGETSIGNWIVDAMNESANSQIAFTNPGGIRADLPAGPITGDGIYKVCPFPNTICTTTMGGEQLLRFLEQCASLNPIPISGLRFGFDKNLPEGSRVLFAELMDGTAINKEASYKVTTNSFLKDGKDGYTVLGENLDWTDTSVLMRDAMTQYVMKYGTVKTELDGRIVDMTK